MLKTHSLCIQPKLYVIRSPSFYKLTTHLLKGQWHWPSNSRVYIFFYIGVVTNFHCLFVIIEITELDIFSDKSLRLDSPFSPLLLYLTQGNSFNQIVFFPMILYSFLPRTYVHVFPLLNTSSNLSNSELWFFSIKNFGK